MKHLLLLTIAGLLALGDGGTVQTSVLGTYEFTSSTDSGAPMKGTITISSAGDSLQADIVTDVMPAVHSNEIAVGRDRITIIADLPSGALILRLRLDGRSVAGGWTRAQRGVPIKGTRTK